MRSVRTQPLARDAFAKYGTFVDLLHPESLGGTCLGTTDEGVLFFPDLMPLYLGGIPETPTLSICRVLRSRGVVVRKSEFHKSTGEGILPLEGTIYLPVSIPSAEEIPPLAEEMEVFTVPKLTFIILKPGVWHREPLIADNSQVTNILIVLPSQIFHRDCTDLPVLKNEQFEIKA